MNISGINNLGALGQFSIDEVTPLDKILRFLIHETFAHCKNLALATIVCDTVATVQHSQSLQ